MRTIEELEKIADDLLPVEVLFFKHGKGWMLDKLERLGITREEYEILKKIVAERRLKR